MSLRVCVGHKTFTYVVKREVDRRGKEMRGDERNGKGGFEGPQYVFGFYFPYTGHHSMTTST